MKNSKFVNLPHSPCKKTSSPIILPKNIPLPSFSKIIYDISLVKRRKSWFSFIILPYIKLGCQ